VWECCDDTHFAVRDLTSAKRCFRVHGVLELETRKSPGLPLGCRAGRGPGGTGFGPRTNGPKPAPKRTYRPPSPRQPLMQVRYIPSHAI